MRKNKIDLWIGWVDYLTWPEFGIYCVDRTGVIYFGLVFDWTRKVFILNFPLSLQLASKYGLILLG